MINIPKNKIKVGLSLKDLLENNPNQDLLNKSEKIDSPKNDNSQSSLTSIKPLDTIIISKMALEKMFFLAEEVFNFFEQPLEVYALCLGEDEVIKDILIPQQHVGYTSVRVNPDFIINLIPIIRQQELDVLGWTHSHADFQVFFSGTDNRNQLTLLAETSNFTKLAEQKVKFVFGMTINIHRKLYGMVTTQFSSGNIRHQQAKFQIIEDLPASWKEQTERNKIKQEIKSKISLRTFQYTEIFHKLENTDK